MFGKIAKMAAVVGLPLTALAVPVSVDLGASSPQGVFRLNQACAADQIAGCEPKAGYICYIDGVQWIDKKPIIIRTADPVPAEPVGDGN